jgi:hypothetical protein
VNVKIGTAKSPTALAIRAVSPGGTAPDDGLRALSPRWGRFVGVVAGAARGTPPPVNGRGKRDLCHGEESKPPLTCLPG